MKVEYEENDEQRGCVAFLDCDGDLWVFVGGDWRCVSGSYEDDLLDESDAKQKFYPGDKITITF